MRQQRLFSRFFGQIKFIDINCAVVTPNAPAAGYRPPQISGDLSKVKGSWFRQVELIVLNPNEVKEGASYKVNFTADGDVPKYKTTDISKPFMEWKGRSNFCKD